MKSTKSAGHLDRWVVGGLLSGLLVVAACATGGEDADWNPGSGGGGRAGSSGHAGSAGRAGAGGGQAGSGQAGQGTAGTGAWGQAGSGQAGSGHAGSSGGGSAGSGGDSCGFNFSDTTCNSCVQSRCYSSCNACATNVDCANLMGCISDCSASDTACPNNCFNSYPNGQDDALAFMGADSGCVTVQCNSQCGGGSGGSGGSSCGFNMSDPTCDSCMQSQCYSACSTCANNPECVALLDCNNGCTTSDCQTNCFNSHPNGQDDALAFLGGDTGCLTVRCDSQCGGGSGGSGGSTCGFSSQDSACNSCLQSTCFSSCAACTANPDCSNLLDCSFNCAAGDDTCAQNCFNQYPNGQDDALAFLGTSGCVSTSCPACNGK